MGILEKHLGRGQKVKIDNEEFELRPLTLENLPEFFMVMKAFSGVKSKDPSEALSGMTRETSEALKEIIYQTLKKSFPEEEDEVVKEFGLRHMSVLMEKIFEINTAVIKDANPELIARIKKIQENVKSRGIKEGNISEGKATK